MKGKGEFSRDAASASRSFVSAFRIIPRISQPSGRISFAYSDSARSRISNSTAVPIPSGLKRCSAVYSIPQEIATIVSFAGGANSVTSNVSVASRPNTTRVSLNFVPTPTGPWVSISTAFTSGIRIGSVAMSATAPKTVRGGAPTHFVRIIFDMVRPRRERRPV